MGIRDPFLAGWGVLKTFPNLLPIVDLTAERGLRRFEADFERRRSFLSVTPDGAFSFDLK